MTRATVEAYLNSFEALAQHLDPIDVNPELLHAFFEAIRLRVDFDADTRIARAHVTLGGGSAGNSEPHTGADVAPGGVSVRVRGGT